VDWFDPNTWKLPAELIGYWQTILVGLAGIGGIILGIIRYGLKPLHWLRSRVKGKAQQKGISLSFVQSDLHCHWQVAKLNDQPGTTVHGRWYVANGSETNVVILKARLGRHVSRFAQVATRHPDNKRDTFGRYPVLSHRMSEVTVDLQFYPPIGRGHEPIISDVIFTDNYENEHRVRGQFHYLGPKPLQPSSPQLSGRI
jgi:hypothetical protein